MSQENTEAKLSTDMRLSAYAAPTAAMERQELGEAHEQANKERIAKLGESAELVLGLEARLATEIDNRKRAQIQADYATRRLDQVLQSVSTALGRDVRDLSIVHFGMALTSSKSKLVTLAGYIDRSLTLDDLIVLKRVASNLGVIPPQTMAESAALMGLSPKRAV